MFHGTSKSDDPMDDDDAELDNMGPGEVARGESPVKLGHISEDGQCVRSAGLLKQDQTQPIGK